MQNTEEKLDILAEVIKEDCVLVIGPYAYLVETDDGRKSLFELLAEKLVAEVPDLEAIAKSNDFHLIASEFAKRKSNTALNLAVKKFYENFQQRISFLENVVEMPFSIIINTTPDDLLLRAMEKKGKLNVQKAHYNYVKQAQHELFTNISVHKPLIYNLLGSVEERSSLVLTQFEQLAFIKNIISEDAGLPKSLIAALNDKTHYLFVGFDFEYWYLRLMFETLGMSNRPETAFGFHQNQEGMLKMPTKIFFSNTYKLEFLEEEPEVFLQQLKERINGNSSPAVSPKNRKKVCVLCHEDDVPLYEKLAVQLKPLFRKYNIETFDYQSVMGGDVIDTAWKNAIDTADIVLPLLSADFLADDYWIDLARSAAKQQGENKKIIPILLRYCDITNEPSLAALPTRLPLNGEPINKWQDRAEAMQDCKNVIEKILKTLAA